MASKVFFSPEEFLNNNDNFLPTEEAGKVFLNLALMSMYALKTVKWVRDKYEVEQYMFRENKLQIKFSCKTCNRIFLDRNKMLWDNESGLFTPEFANGKNGTTGTARTVTMTCLTKHAGRCNSKQPITKLQNTRRKNESRTGRRTEQNVCEQHGSSTSTLPVACEPTRVAEIPNLLEDADFGHTAANLDTEFLVDFDLSDFCSSPRNCSSSNY